MEGSLLQPGRELDEYTLVDRLGQGGFGEVWRAIHKGHEGREEQGRVERHEGRKGPEGHEGRDAGERGSEHFVAIKVATHPEYARSLRIEAEIQAHLTHPNVVHTLAYHPQSEPPYIVMEYVDGESLRALLQREQTLDGARAASILTPILSCLSEAHAQGILHRDIKPENILLSRTGDVKLADFGLGKAAQSTLQSILLSQGGRTGDGFLVGTYEYMAPEQRRGGVVDARTDLYAVGVLLHEMLVGVTNPIRLPVSGVSPELSQIIDRAVRIRPEERYDSAAQMLGELHSAIVPHPTPSTVASTQKAIREDGYLPPKQIPAKKKAGVKPLGCVVGLLAMMMVGGFLAYSEPPTPKKGLVVPPRKVDASGISCEALRIMDPRRPNCIEVDIINDTRARIPAAHLSLDVSGEAAPNGWLDGASPRVVDRRIWYKGERLYVTGRVSDSSKGLVVTLTCSLGGRVEKRTFTFSLAH